MKCLYLCLTACLIILNLSAVAAQEFPIDQTNTEPQMMPDIDGSIVVWSEYVPAYDGYDIFAIDLNGAAGRVHIIDWENDQTAPRISGQWVIWQDDYYGDGTDYDIYLSDISDSSAILRYPIAVQMDISEAAPAIHGPLAAYQQQYTDPDTGAVDWDIYAADMTEPNDPRIYPMTLWFEDQTAPAVFRSNIVFSDFYTWPDGSQASWDITLADMWLKNDPNFQYPTYEPEDETAPAISRDYIVYQLDYSGDGTDYDILAIDYSDPRVFVMFPISQLTSSEENPDISDHIVVWQDNRNGNWDIYGYNLVTKREFQITSDPADQTNPAISGDTVVWEDMRDGFSNIWAVYLDAVDIADCPIPLAGDTNGNCRVDLVDFVKIGENWLACNLDPTEACNN